MVSIHSEDDSSIVRIGNLIQLTIELIYPQSRNALDRANGIAIFFFAILLGLSPNFN